MDICFFSSLLATLVFLTLSGIEVLAIKCWRCRSDLDPRCADPFDNTSFPITDCSVYSLEHFPGLKAAMCRKTRQKVYGQWRYIRSCAFLGSPGEGTGDETYCLMRTGTFDVFVETCTCNSKEGCNSATCGYSNLSLFILTAILFWVQTIFTKIVKL
ncbi:UPAR/Ly6 domain-containing protein crok-like [Tachypleus tridentatus]|uniref:UPAR/Ly6 domain-containing protein crok-like n=1 Tax=Tachypleus tridentatus TaxID=6853 RepID=UPI003FD67C92